MRRLVAVGVGAGDPEHITVAGIEALNAADVLFEIERGAVDLTRAREALIRRYVTRDPPPRIVAVTEPKRDRTAEDYVGAVDEWRSRRADAWEATIAETVPVDGCGAFLVWGDPSLYDSTIAVLDEILARGRVRFGYEVVPGVSSLHALTARHRIALNRAGGAVQITTGRRLVEHGWPPGVQDVVVMLDADCAFRQVIDEPLDIYWGAYLGTADEILLSGPLAAIAETIVDRRAKARAARGWIMDLYLLRRR
jgi:precorrin-6A synthase